MKYQRENDSEVNNRRKRILIVCRWPLGGIRTYLAYNYHCFSREEFDITLLACPSIEQESLDADMAAEGIPVVWSTTFLGLNTLFLRTAVLLLKGRIDLVHSQGFISAFHVSLSNWIFRVPHVLTIHGVLENKYFGSWTGLLKRSLLRLSLKNVTVFHGVGRDILEHVRSSLPALVRGSAKWTVITNGIRVDRCLSDIPFAGREIRKRHGISRDTFIFGFFGRFMPQKGFNYIIDAVGMLTSEGRVGQRFVVVSAGSGDYEREYKDQVCAKELTDYFIFAPFDPELPTTIKGCDAVLMPSVWEAWGLLACETMCCGIPLIGTTCIGLREVLQNSPAIAIPPHDPLALAEAMQKTIENPGLKELALRFRQVAAHRFDVTESATRLASLFRESIAKR